MAKIAICYAAASGIIRWVAGSDTGDVVVSRHQAGNGEALLLCDHSLVVDANGFFQESLATQQVALAIGRQPQNAACAVVLNNVVTEIIRADPALDVRGGAILVQAYSPQIYAGCTYNAGTGLFTTPQVNIPRGTRNGVTTPAQTIPPTVIPKP